MLLEPIDESRTDAFVEALSDGTPVQISTSDALAFNDLALALERVDDAETVEVLTDDDTVTEFRDHFLSGTTLREFTQNGTLEIRSQPTPLSTFVISATTVTAVTGFPDAGLISLETADDSAVDDTNRVFTTRFEEASAVTLRKPPYSVLLSELVEWFDADVRADFETALQVARDSNRPSLSLHPATICVVVGAANELEFYEVGRWAEDTRLASKATLSRKKNDLEERGVIDVEPIQGQVGRPRHRLLLGGVMTNTGSIEDLVEAVDGMLPG